MGKVEDTLVPWRRGGGGGGGVGREKSSCGSLTRGTQTLFVRPQSPSGRSGDGSSLFLVPGIAIRFLGLQSAP